MNLLKARSPHKTDRRRNRLGVNDTLNWAWSLPILPIITFGCVLFQTSSISLPSLECKLPAIAVLIIVSIQSYTQVHYLARAVGGALRQSLSNLEILISDDCLIDLAENTLLQLQAIDQRVRLILYIIRGRCLLFLCFSLMETE
jgi:hypothetical protein